MAASVHVQFALVSVRRANSRRGSRGAPQSGTLAIASRRASRHKAGCRAVYTPSDLTSSESEGFVYEIPSPSAEAIGLGQQLSLSCNLEGCSLSQEHSPGFTFLNGNGWRIGFEASPTSEDDFCATIGGDTWSLALSARQFHEFCHLFKVLTSALEDASRSLQGSLMLTGATVFVEARVTNQEALEGWRDQINAGPFVQVHVGLTSSKPSTAQKSQGGYWDDVAIAEMMVKAKELFWSSSDAQTGSAVPDSADLSSVTLASGDASDRQGGAVVRADETAAALAPVVDGLGTATRESSAVEPSVDRSGSKHPAGRSSSRRKLLDTSGPITGYSETLKNFWFPVAFSKDLDEKTTIPFDCFEQAWVLFRGANGEVGCVKDECAHRACPLSLGTVNEGKLTCPYHGWEFEPSGKCVKMPSTRTTSVRVKALPCVEWQGLVWVWPGKGKPDDVFPDTLPPSNYLIHAEIVIDLPVEHGLLVENLLDLAHAPFTHTTTFAKGWSVPNLVRFKTPQAALALKGHWDPYPIAMEFRPPCVVVSTIGLVKPGQLEASSQAQDCQQHLFQLHACVPSGRGSTRLLYRMGLDFARWVKHVPFIQRLWMYLANQVLDEDLRLVVGQQDRMKRGANVWNHPVVYDKLGVNYRRWRNGVEEEDLQINN